MATELKFFKSDSGTSWGFRLVGGVDFGQPVVVVKVKENSLAEASGLEVGDVIVRVNETATSGLTHAEVHDLLVSAGQEFTFGIRRDLISAKQIKNEEITFEDCAALKQILEKEIVEKTRSANVNVNVNAEEEIKDKENVFISENLAGQEEMVFTGGKLATTPVNKTEWSTFLMKPETPIPKSKKQVKEEAAKGEPYRVVIKKQLGRFQEKKVQFDNAVVKTEEANELKQSEEAIKEAIRQESSIQTQSNRLEIDVEITEKEEETVEVEITEATDDNSADVDVEVIEEQARMRNNSIELESKEEEKEEEEETSSNNEISLTLEQQLLAVQQQLQALSQLPSAIQVTLDAVSKQLASIVGAKTNSEGYQEGREEEEEEEKEYLEEEGECSESEEAEAESMEADKDDNNSNTAEELEEDVIEPKDDEEDKFESLTEIEEENDIEKDLLAKKQKAMDKSEYPPKPVQRPIVLPGGRKWADEEDAITGTGFRKPKMSDEKIVETIECSLEVIVGNRKGINFLKYQPAPKNLDYLQRSEVYRLVHDMEPPVKGITSRPEKILSEQDYYQVTTNES